MHLRSFYPVVLTRIVKRRPENRKGDASDIWAPFVRYLDFQSINFSINAGNFTKKLYFAKVKRGKEVS